MDFDYCQGHRGGIGDTLNLVGCGSSVHMEWAYGGLDAIVVGEGWDGQTERGLRIGDSFEKFVELYGPPRIIGEVSFPLEPPTDYLGRPSYLEVPVGYHMKVRFNADGLVDKIGVGQLNWTLAWSFDD